jgi:hypothetical protein
MLGHLASSQFVMNLTCVSSSEQIILTFDFFVQSLDVCCAVMQSSMGTTPMHYWAVDFYVHLLRALHWALAVARKKFD